MRRVELDPGYAMTQSAVHVACPINSGSNESEHMIIRKNVTWAVDYNER
jgi:hypothetical protein